MPEEDMVILLLPPTLKANEDGAPTTPTFVSQVKNPRLFPVKDSPHWKTPSELIPPRVLTWNNKLGEDTATPKELDVVSVEKLPVEAVVLPMAPGAAKVAPLRLLALRLATLVVEVTTKGAVPIAIVDVNCVALTALPAVKSLTATLTVAPFEQ